MPRAQMLINSKYGEVVSAPLGPVSRFLYYPQFQIHNGLWFYLAMNVFMYLVYTLISYLTCSFVVLL